MTFVFKLCSTSNFHLVPNQVVQARSLNKGFTVMTKLVAQINCKLKGALWSVHTSMCDSLIIGIDLWKALRADPVLSIVAALDTAQTRFFSCQFVQRAGENSALHIEPAVKRKSYP